MSDQQQQTLSIPSLLLLAALSALAVRYFFFTPASSSTTSTRSRTANPADVEQISQMFPQISRRDIMWDLQRNGGSVAATTERVLSRGTLDTVSRAGVSSYQRCKIYLEWGEHQIHPCTWSAKILIITPHPSHPTLDRKENADNGGTRPMISSHHLHSNLHSHHPLSTHPAQLAPRPRNPYPNKST